MWFVVVGFVEIFFGNSVKSTKISKNPPDKSNNGVPITTVKNSNYCASSTTSLSSIISCCVCHQHNVATHKKRPFCERLSSEYTKVRDHQEEVKNYDCIEVW